MVITDDSMSELRQIAKAVVISWSGMASAIIAGFIMAPFLVHHLGVAGYGVWVLIQSTISYMYLMDLGLRTAVIRFVAHDYTNGNHSEVSCIVSAALWVRFWSATVVVLISFLVALLLSHLFSIPPQYLMSARVALVLMGFTFASTLVFSVFSATLMAIGSYSLFATLETWQIVLTTLGLIPIVNAGYGLIGMAGWCFVVVTANNVAIAAACFRRYPQLKLTITGVPQRRLLKELWSVGSYYAGYNLADQLITYTDTLVVATFISAPAVAYYAVAGRMVLYVRQIAVAIIKYFMPLASAAEARNKSHSLQQLQLKGTQIILLVTLPIVVTLFIRGGTFLGLWIGPDFEGKATPILQILMATTGIMMTNAGATGLTVAMGKQRWLALFALTEGLANLTLSIILAKSMGMIGVAIGTAVPSIFMQVFIWPRFMCNLLQISLLRFFREIWLRPALALAPFVITSYIVESHWPAHNLWQFFGQTLASTPAFALGTFLVFRAEIPHLMKYADNRAETIPV
jgi:O-antigen/teichoic acid export membrane protein